MVVEDQPRMLELVTRYLQENGVETVGCTDGDDALGLIADTDPDVVVLDLMLPGLGGMAICRALRAAGDDVPVIMLTARGEVTERVAGLEAGADDYLVKPFALEELWARVKAVARRRAEPVTRLTAGDVVLDLEARKAWVGGSEVALTRREYGVLAAFVARPGIVIPKGRLYDLAWDGDDEVRSNALEVYISHVRAHLAASSRVSITTLRGVGYRLDVDR